MVEKRKGGPRGGFPGPGAPGGVGGAAAHGLATSNANSSGRNIRRAEAEDATPEFTNITELNYFVSELLSKHCALNSSQNSVARQKSFLDLIRPCN